MKSKDVQKLVLSKYESSGGPSEIFQDLNGTPNLITIKSWCKMVRETSTIQLSKSPDPPRTFRTKESTRKVKTRLNRKRKVSIRKLVHELDLSYGSARQILKNDLKLRSYKIVIEPLLTDEHKEKRKKFSNWVRTHFRKEDTMNTLFSEEKLFDIDGIYNSQND